MAQIYQFSVLQFKSVLRSLWHCISFLYVEIQFSGSWHLPPTHFTVIPTESCPVGTSNTIIVNERNREHDKQEAWLLMELQKLRRQIEASEIRMVQRAPLGVDQGALHDFSVRIQDLEVTMYVLSRSSQTHRDCSAEHTVFGFLISWEWRAHSANGTVSFQLKDTFGLAFSFLSRSLSRKSWLSDFRREILSGYGFKKPYVNWMSPHVKCHPG